MEFLSPRQYNSCPAGTLFYDCSYPYVFSGCCANNACADGVCLPQFVPSSVISSEIASGFPPGAVTPFPLPIATSSPSTTSVTSTPPAPTSSPSPSDTTPDSTPPSTTTIHSSSTVPPTTTPLPSITSFPHPHPRTSNKGAIAGGVVGGVAAVALLLFLLWFCLRRRKRQQSVNTANLHRSVSAEALGEAKTNPPVIPSPSPPGTEAYFLDGDYPVCQAYYNHKTDLKQGNQHGTHQQPAQSRPRPSPDPSPSIPACKALPVHPMHQPILQYQTQTWTLSPKQMNSQPRSRNEQASPPNSQIQECTNPPPS